MDGVTFKRELHKYMIPKLFFVSSLILGDNCTTHVYEHAHQQKNNTQIKYKTFSLVKQIQVKLAAAHHHSILIFLPEKGFSFMLEISFSLFVKHTLIYILLHCLCALFHYWQCLVANCYSDMGLFVCKHAYMRLKIKNKRKTVVQHVKPKLHARTYEIPNE